MAFENMESDHGIIMEEPPPISEPNNRPFLIVAGILGGITLLALACIALYALVILPQRRAQQNEQLARLNIQNTQIAQAITQTAVVTATPTATRIPSTPTRTPTPVVVIPTNTRVASTADPRTATVAALLTQAVAAQRTATVRPTSTALPATGFADEVGAPGMFGLAVALIAVIFLARRLRMAG